MLFFEFFFTSVITRTVVLAYVDNSVDLMILNITNHEIICMLVIIHLMIAPKNYNLPSHLLHISKQFFFTIYNSFSIIVPGLSAVPRPVNATGQLLVDKSIRVPACINVMN